MTDYQKFSQRIGKTSVRNAIQIESIDESLSNRLWNNILEDLFNKVGLKVHGITEADHRKSILCKNIWMDFFGNRLDEIPSVAGGRIFVGGVLKIIKSWFFGAPWYEKYDFIEFISILDSKTYVVGVAEKFNQSLKLECAGYRILDNRIVPITSENEIAEIQEAIDSCSDYKPVETHLKTSLDYLSNRTDPDYRNSIKESISAVESMCIILTGDKNATLGKALSKIETRFNIHGALKNAFSALYGYTSDSGGIRHSLLEDDIEVSMEDAKFMLIACSAFINYLKTKA